MKPTSDIDTEVLLEPDLTKYLNITQQGNTVIIKPKRRLPYIKFVQLCRKVRDMGGHYLRKKQRFEVPIGDKYNE